MKKYFLILIAFFFIIAGYFYVFPRYGFDDISDEYFYTIHQNKDIWSSENGFWILKKILDINIQEGIGEYFDIVSEIESKKYITSSKTEEDFLNFNTLKDINQFIIENESDKILQQTNFLIDLLNKMDTNLINSVILFHLIDKNYIYMKDNIIDTSNLRPITRENIIQNWLKHEYITVSKWLLNELWKEKTFKTQFFYSEKETSNILKTQFYASINQEEMIFYKANGRNLIGRTLTQISVVNMDKYFQQENELRILLSK